jgi:hypothetical protein
MRMCKMSKMIENLHYDLRACSRVRRGPRARHDVNDEQTSKCGRGASAPMSLSFCRSNHHV